MIPHHMAYHIATRTNRENRMSINQLLITLLSALVLVAATASPLQAKVVTKSITYMDGDVELEGYYAWDDAVERKRPAVLIVHAWWGLGEDEKARARQLAELGYAAFALDMYGKGKFTDDPGQAGAWAGVFYQDRQLARSRAGAGLKQLVAQREVDRARVAAIGYCFGGSIVVDLAFSGADLRGVVSFHGNPLPALEGDAPRTRASLLLCHGAADTLVPMESIQAFTDSIAESSIDWQLVVYSGAKHSFTTPSVDKMNIAGAGYNAAADRRSWAQMNAFLDEILGR
jgi:dienelactone hydrolase